MKCKQCKSELAKNWEDLVKDINNPLCGFCDGTMNDLLYDLIMEAKQ